MGARAASATDLAMPRWQEHASQVDFIGDAMTRRHLISRRKMLALGAGSVFGARLCARRARRRARSMSIPTAACGRPPGKRRSSIRSPRRPGSRSRPCPASPSPSSRRRCRPGTTNGTWSTSATSNTPRRCSKDCWRRSTRRPRKPASCRRTWCASTASPAIRSAPISSTARTSFRTAARRAGRISGT